MRTASIVGSGPNGLAAAVTLARAGIDVTVHEAEETAGGGTRTMGLTLPGHRHDLCSAVHPMALSSPFFRAFELTRRVDYLVPELSYAQAITPGRSAYAWRDLERTADGLGRDGGAWRRTFAALSADIDRLADLTLGHMLHAWRDLPTLARVGVGTALRTLPGGGWRTPEARALFAGVAAHGITRLPSLGASAVGLALAAHAHAGGWPVPRGGADAVARALTEDLLAHGGTIRTGERITSLDQVRADVVLFDVDSRQLADIAGDALPAGYRRALRHRRLGGGAAKIDIALDGDVPWLDETLRRSPTVHIGGTAAEVATAENDTVAGRHPRTPFVLLVQPSVIDQTRAPAGCSVIWAYTHVPNGSDVDMTDAILHRIETMAPGFRSRVRAVVGGRATDTEAHDAAYPGGDISGGLTTMWSLLARPVLAPAPWRTPARGVYLCSASTVPGPGVHGMGGWLAARTALGDLGLSAPDLSIGA